MSPIPRPWMGLLAFLIALGLHVLLLSGLVLGREGAAAPPPTPSFELVTLASPVPPPALAEPPQAAPSAPQPAPVQTPPPVEPEPVPPPEPEAKTEPPLRVEPKPPPRARSKAKPQSKPRSRAKIRHRPRARPTVAPGPQRSVRSLLEAQRSAMASAPKRSEGPVYQPPDAFAAYLHNPAPVYPRRARRRRHQGLVLIQVQVSADGRPLTVELARSSGHRELDRAALAAVKGWRFRPAQRGGKAVTARVEVPVRFRLKKG